MQLSISKNVMSGLIELTQKKCQLTLHKKWSLPLGISSVNVTKSTVSCEFDHIYWRNPFIFCEV